MPVRLRGLARQNDLDASIERVDRCRWVLQSRVDQHEYASLGFLQSQDGGEMQQIRAQLCILPYIRNGSTLRFSREQVALIAPQWCGTKMLDRFIGIYLNCHGNSSSMSNQPFFSYVSATISMYFFR